MALTNCPSCNKRISSKAPECPHCGFNLQGQSDSDLDREWARMKQLRKDKLAQQSMLSLLILIASFAYWAIQQPEPKSLPANLSIGLMVIGGIWYVITRFRMAFLGKRRR
ncbi:hypothetical protein SAMN06297229_1344 [Pseudidiomarina planktonica]|uniref:Zinc-ribbon domain-containing protein n=1 Tax=Pseudidiomarina planktonica TaxID=1323738 RepID=A0A1Y6ESM7_9GAMM|nr:zinc ribbon domain-containing protein [Pseudidiomarina planktonica]RUO65268.1 zinc ribbon domain-containing protein [Pseudidiomarina planktonica]SMQ65738.1 hypothetical protein SAMN06297229_1344 [Pseudidiomarina planktonica]